MKNFNQLLCVSLMALLLPLQGCAETYIAKAITGKVVDAETGEPLKGVNIVAKWEIDRRSAGDKQTVQRMVETVSDQNGNYSFPASAPIPRPPLLFQHGGSDPRIVYFKSGYLPAAEQNDFYVNTSDRRIPFGEFKGNGKTIKLKKWDGKDVNEYASRVSTISGGLDSTNQSDLWRSYPRMLFTLINEQERLKKLGNTYAISGICAKCYGPEYLEYIRKFGQ